MWVSRYFVWFVAYSVLGWVWESTYCTARERRWENRGFLYGPVCPIYGTGAILGIILWEHVTLSGPQPAWWQVFLLAMVGSAVLEYLTSWGLERAFHARWWDYSDMPLNVNGRICLPASVLFGLAGVLVAYVMYLPTVDVTADVPPAAMEALSLVLMGILAADIAITVSALARFAAIASSINQGVNDHMEQVVARAVERSDAAAEELQERREQAGLALSRTKEQLAQERERFAEGLRESRAGEMGAVVRGAARRVRAFVATEGRDGRATAEELSRLLEKVSRRR